MLVSFRGRLAIGWRTCRHAWHGRMSGARSMRSRRPRRRAYGTAHCCSCLQQPGYATKSCGRSNFEIFIGVAPRSWCAGPRRDATASCRSCRKAGKALADYVLHARPKIDSPRVFLSHRPPVGPFRTSGSISRIVRSRLEQSGLALPRFAGAHLVRHSLATQLVGQRRPINEVADLLGHRSIDTTAIYVKVALPQLADVALPFPGGTS